MKIDSFVRRVFDDEEMTDDLVDAIVFGCTGYPSFFPKGDPVKHFSRQIHHAKRSLSRGFTIDDIYFGSDTLKPADTNKKSGKTISQS